jgi:hypothetical protein
MATTCRRYARRNCRPVLRPASSHSSTAMSMDKPRRPNPTRFGTLIVIGSLRRFGTLAQVRTPSFYPTAQVGRRVKMVLKTWPKQQARAKNAKNEGIMTALIIDTGKDIVGVFSVEENSYVAYRGDAIQSAIQRIEAADEVVTYNGSVHDGWSDLVKLGEWAGRADGDSLLLKGTHTDMRIICWSDRIQGSSPINTYLKHYSQEDCPRFPYTSEGIPEGDENYVGSNQRDVYMTFKLWELWKQGKLKIVDGFYV